MIRPIAVEARYNCRIWLQFEDGEAGEIVPTTLRLEPAVFKAWEDLDFFRDVRSLTTTRYFGAMKSTSAPMRFICN